MKDNKLNIGLIGSGFMGKAHANAFRNVSSFFNNLSLKPTLHTVADINEKSAMKAKNDLGFINSTGDWKELVDNPDIDLVSITSPNVLHESMAIRAINLNKIVYCEKPLSHDLNSAKRMLIASKKKNSLTLVGYNFLRSPMIALAKEIIDSGEIGEIWGFRGIHAENYMGKKVPHSFRTNPLGGGALNDIGSHILSIARYLLGPIKEVIGQQETHILRRKNNKILKKVYIDDRTVFMGKFKTGVTGSFEACWISTGQKMNLSYEIIGSKGSIKFSYERLNELQLFSTKNSQKLQGFSKIEAGPEHYPYGNFCPAPGHQLGFNDLKIIESAHLIECYEKKQKAKPGFDEAYEIQKTLEAIKRSSKERVWITV